MEGVIPHQKKFNLGRLTKALTTNTAFSRPEQLFRDYIRDNTSVPAIIQVTSAYGYPHHWLLGLT